MFHVHLSYVFHSLLRTTICGCSREQQRYLSTANETLPFLACRYVIAVAFGKFVLVVLAQTLISRRCFPT